MRVQKLYVVVPWFNPVRYASRYQLFRDFAAHMRSLEVELVIVELAFGDRPFEVTESENEMHLQLRTDQELWLKENLINLGIAHLRNVRHDAEYVAWIDADIQFQRRDIATETIQQLQHYDVVQLFSHAVDMGPQGQNIRSDCGFMYQYHRNGAVPPTNAKGTGCGITEGFWHPGYAWAARMDVLIKLPLLDFTILGSADHHMALSIVGKPALSIPDGISPGYRSAVETWGKLAEIQVRRNVSYVPGLITHAWHGDKMNRKYVERWEILKEIQYCPSRDLTRNIQGLYRLNDFMDERSIWLRDKVRAYFRQRDEDSTYLPEGH